MVFYGTENEFSKLLTTLFPTMPFKFEKIEYGICYRIGEATINHFCYSRSHKVTIQGKPNKIKYISDTLKNELDYETYDKRSNRPYKTDDGHFVRTRGELMVDNWLYKNKYNHAYEKQIPNSDYLSDFYLPKYKIYIEVWANFEGSAKTKYQNRKKEKQEFYIDQKLKLLEIEQDDLYDINKSLENKINQIIT